MENFYSVTILQYCLEAESLCIDLAERENREIFHMFISRTARDKQPSPSLSVLPLKAQSEQVIKILLSQGELPLLLQKHRVEKTATMLCRSLSSSWLPLSIYEICTRCSYISSPPIHHVPSDRVIKTCLKIFHQNTTGPRNSWCVVKYCSDQQDLIWTPDPSTILNMSGYILHLMKGKNLYKHAILTLNISLDIEYALYCWIYYCNKKNYLMVY